MAETAGPAGRADTPGKTAALRLGWLAFAIAPPVIGVKLWPGLLERPWLALAAGLAYEAVVVGAGFFRGVFGDLRKRWQQRLTDHTDDALRRRFSRYRSRYLEYVHFATQGIEQLGIPRKAAWAPPLEKIFIDVALIRRPAHETHRDALVGRHDIHGRRRPLRFFLDGEQPIVLAVLGAPGIGKTTLLRRTAYDLSRRPRLPWRRSRRLPVFLRLRDHARLIVDTDHLTLPQVIAKDLSGHCGEEPPGWFDRQLKDGNCVVMLDGLDEVAGEADRTKIAAWVDAQVRRYRANKFILTSRPHGYVDLEGAVVVQAQPLTPEQIHDFAHAWYTASAESRIEHRHNDAEARQTRIAARAAAERLLDDLRVRHDLWMLATNPLLLTMLSILHESDTALPQDRAQLYSDIVELLVWRRQRDKRGGVEPPEDLPGKQKELVLSELAFFMMTAGITVIDASEAREIVEELLPDISEHRDADAFLDDIVATGLLIRPDTGTLTFAHKTFQEYLAAVNIKENARTGRLATEVGSDWWRETILLFVARSPSDEIIRACLDRDDIDALALAFDCADNLHRLDRRLKERLAATLAEAADPATPPDRRRLLTAVTVRRALRQTIPLAGGAALCMRPIDQEVYRLFQRDMAEQGRSQEPDAPDPEPALNAPAVGMRGEDAAALVEWVTRLLEDGPAVRLPTRAELDSPDVRPLVSNRGRTIWSLDEEDLCAPRPVLWVPPGMSHPWSTTPGRASARAAKDAETLREYLDEVTLLQLAEIVVDLMAVGAMAEDFKAAIAGVADLGHAEISASGLPQQLELAGAYLGEGPRGASGPDDPDIASIHGFVGKLMDSVLRPAADALEADGRQPTLATLESMLREARRTALATSRDLALSLDLAIEHTADLPRAIETALAKAYDLTGTLGCAVDLAEDAGQATAMAIARDWASSLAGTLGRAHDGVRHLAPDLPRDLHTAAALHRALIGVLDSALASTRDLSGSLERSRCRDDVHRLARALASDLDDTLDRASMVASASTVVGTLAHALTESTEAWDRVRSKPRSAGGEHALRVVTRARSLLSAPAGSATTMWLRCIRAGIRGHAAEMADVKLLDSVLSLINQRRGPRQDRSDPLARITSILTATHANGIVVPPGLATTLLREGLTRLAQGAADDGRAVPRFAEEGNPVVRLAARMVDVGEEWLDRRKTVDERAPSLLIVGSLAIATVVSQRGDAEAKLVGDLYMKAALGMTVAQERLVGTATPNETITLVVEAVDVP
ncbi:NACHT domain-containing protein [Sphaerisporangium sp. NPDC005288]|uniref:NACHT domain-containing protein n=1 Tax=Sphaerisporangium sp. NPDC005288 TaxID=3155114 RepID=UPI0033AED5AC